MVSRSPKPPLSVALATLDQEVSGLRDKLGAAWLLGKQWPTARSIHLPVNQKSQVFRTVLARKSQLERAGIVGTRRANTSFSGLLISKDRFGEIVKNKTTTAKTRIAGSMKKTFSFSKTGDRKDGMLSSLKRRLGQDNQPEEMYLPEVEVESEVETEPDHSEQYGLVTQEREQISLAVETQAKLSIPTPKKQQIQETPTECLTCQKLIHCNIRAQLSPETADASQDIAPCHLLGITA